MRRLRRSRIAEVLHFKGMQLGLLIIQGSSSQHMQLTTTLYHEYTSSSAFLGFQLEMAVPREAIVMVNAEPASDSYPGLILQSTF